MSYTIARRIGWIAVALGCVWLVRRYRLWGVLASMAFGSAILYVAYHVASPVPGQWDEDGEEILSLGPIVIAMLCFPIWIVVGILTGFTKNGKFHP